ncbi:hypothetical protein CLAIMM_11027 [Cladophialophora immunda]|nr:hypothetical protein CLAIMM_11027 [Cladophialophora immunda]
MIGMKRQLPPTAMSIPSTLISEVPPPPSHDELLQKLRDLNLAVKPDIDHRTAKRLTQLIDRINSDEDLKQYLNDAFASNKSSESSNGGDDPVTVAPIPIDPALNSVESPSDNDSGNKFAHEVFEDQMSDGDSSRFRGKPVTVMVRGTEYFVHERIFESMFPHEVAPEAGGIFELDDLPKDLFEAVLEGEYGTGIGIREWLDDICLETLEDFALKYGNMPLLATVYQILPIDLGQKETLARIAEIYCWHQGAPVAFRGFFRDWLRQELPQRLRDGSSWDLISLIANEFRNAGDGMEDVSMVLHGLWTANTTTAKPCGAGVVSQDNIKNNSDNCHGSRSANSANDVEWCTLVGDLAPNNGWVNDVDAGVKPSSSWKIPSADHSASDPFPAQLDPVQPPAPPVQYIWGHTTSRHLNTPSFMPEPPPAPACRSSSAAAPLNDAVPPPKTSALARCLHLWLGKQHGELGRPRAFTAEEVAAGFICTVSEARLLLSELVGAGLVVNYECLYHVEPPKAACTSSWYY